MVLGEHEGEADGEDGDGGGGELDHSLDPSLHTTVRLLMPLWMMGTALW